MCFFNIITDDTHVQFIDYSTKKLPPKFEFDEMTYNLHSFTHLEDVLGEADHATAYLIANIQPFYISNSSVNLLNIRNFIEKMESTTDISLMIYQRY